MRSELTDTEDDNARTSGNGIQSIDVGMRVLRAIAGRPLPLTLRQIAIAAGMTPSNTHRYLVSFTNAQLVTQDKSSGRYTLGSYALQLGLTALARLEPDAVASRAMARLRDELDRTVFLTIWMQGGPTLVRWLDASQPLSVSVKVGYPASLTQSTSGRIFLGFEKWERVKPLVAKELAQRRSEGRENLLTLGEARAMRAEIVATGLSRVLGDVIPGVHGLSAPIFNSSGALAAAISTVGLAQTFDASFHGETAARIRAVAAAASFELGFQSREDSA
ncbi:MAG: IclR family transcriptional regulator [Pseudomonadota bacterium]|nr:IclR family transcriptional regulator [Pseudomonadota bacterium]